MNESFYGKLGSPELTVGPLDMWVHGYAHPESLDDHDGNWLRITAMCSVSGAAVRISATALQTLDLARLRDQVGAMKESLTGTAKLESYEPYLSIELAVEKTGTVSGTVRITPDHLSQRHEMDFEIDQTFLTHIDAQLDSLLTAWPIRGEKK